MKKIFNKHKGSLQLIQASFFLVNLETFKLELEFSLLTSSGGRKALSNPQLLGSSTPCIMPQKLPCLHHALLLHALLWLMLVLFICLYAVTKENCVFQGYKVNKNRARASSVIVTQ